MKVMKKIGSGLIMSVLLGSLLLVACGKDQKKEEAEERLETVKAVSELMFTYPSGQMDELWKTMEQAATVIGQGVEDGAPSEEDVKEQEEMLEEIFGSYFSEDGYQSLVSEGTILYPAMKVMGNQGKISLKSVKEVEDSSDKDESYQYEAMIDVNGEEITQNMRITFDDNKIQDIEYLDNALQKKIYE